MLFSCRIARQSCYCILLLVNSRSAIQLHLPRELVMSISDDVILEQVEYTFDGASNVILAVTRERYHNAVASQTGPLNDPSTTPKARVTHVAFYHDGIGRVIATADYGTNGGTAFSRSPTIPARSDTVLVTTFGYDSAGNLATLVINRAVLHEAFWL